MKLIILKIEANHHEALHRNEERAKEIFLKIETNRHEKEFPKKEIKETTQKRSNPKRKHFEGI
jgi:hypothetical protein